MNRDSSVAGLASLVQSRGRNGDSMLVHMTPGEVQGLQALALSAGGSLTVNPDTGLVEANFLKKLLPTLLGFGLNFLVPGLGALGSAALVGGVEGLRTGDLGKGLMAGLGAFGGASLGAGLSSAAAGGSSALTGVTPTGLVPGTEAFRQAAAAAAPTSAATSFAPTAAASQMANTGSFLSSTASPAATVARSAAEAARGGFTDSLTTGLRNLATPAGRTAFMEGVPGGMTGLMAGGMGIANAMTPEFQPPMSPEEEQMYYESYGYDPSQGRFLGGQFRRGYPGYSGYAAGGPVMPRTNYNYPQAGITKSNYAPSLEYAKPREILDGYDAKIDPFTGEEKFADGGSVDQPVNVIDRAAPISNQQTVNAVSPSEMEKYYQSLLTPPQQTAADPKFAEYMQGLNKFVTSPVAPPPPPPKPPAATPTTPTTPNQPFDPSKFDFSNFNFGDFMNGSYGGDIAEYLANMGQTGNMRWDPAQGRFVSGTGTPTATTPATTTPTTGAQNQYDPSQFDPSQFQYNPFQDGLDYSQFLNSENRLNNQDTAPAATTGPTGQIAYEDNAYMANQVPDYSQFDFAGGTPSFDMGNAPVGNLTDINQFAEPSYNQPFQYDFSGIGQMGQMGDMGAYATQFQGFQPQSTDFGSTYQPPAMNTPIFNAQPYAPQQMDFGSMGDYGLGALGTTYSAPTFQAPTMDFSSPAPSVPTTSFQNPMTTGPMSTGETAPQFGFGNSDVLYGQSMLGGGEPNIFGFAQGGSVQRAAAGKLITGDGDGMSDDIRANINGNQEARLADGEFVIPADVVSHLGNGSTDAGADQLHAMMDRIRKARTGRTSQAPEIDADKYLLA